MFTTRIIDIKEKDRFNSFVRSHTEGRFLQTWEWAETKRRIGWQPLPLILEKDGEIEASLLILKKKLPLPWLNRCIFYAPHGPVVDIENEELCQALFVGTERVARDHKAIFIKIDPHIPDNEKIKCILSNCNFQKNNTGLKFSVFQTCDLDEVNSSHSLYRYKKSFNEDTMEFVGDWDRVYSPISYYAWNKIIFFYTKAFQAFSKKRKEPSNNL